MDFGPAMQAYLAGWIALCLAAAVLMVRERHRLSLFSTGYRLALKVPWKLATFAIALVGIVVVAPYTGDPTWDYYDAAFMAVLTYLSAPWSLGTLYLALRRRAALSHTYIAACLWLFSASWGYDVYLLVRDGVYPVTWDVNLAASSVLYVCAGLLWSLEWRPSRGVTFGFLEPGWPAPAPAHGFSRLALIALPFMIIAAAGVLYFLF